jgi:5-methylcytosine-specific restriction enzyme A
VPNEIPEASRSAVREREKLRCLRCGGPGTDWHHRRRRGIKGWAQHHPVNGVWLCRTCHNWAHSEVFEARRFGFIVSAYEDDPGTVPVQAWYGWIKLNRDKSVEVVYDYEETK